MITANQAGWDRAARFLAGVALLAAALAYGVRGVALAGAIVLAVVLLATSLAGWCPLYSLLRTGTRRVASGRTLKS